MGAPVEVSPVRTPLAHAQDMASRAQVEIAPASANPDSPEPPDAPRVAAARRCIMTASSSRVTGSSGRNVPSGLPEASLSPVTTPMARQYSTAEVYHCPAGTSEKPVTVPYSDGTLVLRSEGSAQRRMTAQTWARVTVSSGPKSPVSA